MHQDSSAELEPQIEAAIRIAAGVALSEFLASLSAPLGRAATGGPGLPALPPRGPAEFATLSDWLVISGMGRTVTYEALARGDLRAIKLGTRLLIDVPHGLAWLRTRPPANIRLPVTMRKAQQGRSRVSKRHGPTPG